MSISSYYFIRSQGHCISPFCIASDLLDISNPHEYADMLLNKETCS